MTALTACGGSALNSGTTAAVCSYSGQGYLAGTTFASTDGCNTCNCTANGEVVCTERACVRAHSGCDYNGQHYTSGATFDANCNLCNCTIDGQVVCTERACVQRPVDSQPACVQDADCVLVALDDCCPNDKIALSRSEASQYKRPSCDPNRECPMATQVSAACDSNHICVLAER